MKKDLMPEYEAIRNVITMYLDAGAKGRSEIMKPVTHPQAIMWGHRDGGLVGGGIQELYDILDNSPPSRNLKAEITCIDIIGQVASEKVESDDWDGERYSDILVLVHENGHWKILTKV